ncbi:MAG: SAM-dependent methyltransferase, partial [Clostridiales bacterium]|nr:SAM-dependent methyltransferase [Clostridiales bacterium]
NVFRTVIQNIIDSMKRSPRDIYIMLYYPTFEYQKVIRDSRYFILKDIIRHTDSYKDPNDKVYVYHMSRYFV